MIAGMEATFKNVLRSRTFTAISLKRIDQFEYDWRENDDDKIENLFVNLNDKNSHKFSIFAE